MSLVFVVYLKLIFYRNTPIKHHKHLDKPIHDIKKIKLTQGQNDSRDKIYLIR